MQQSIVKLQRIVLIFIGFLAEFNRFIQIISYKNVICLAKLDAIQNYVIGITLCGLLASALYWAGKFGKLLILL